MDHYAELGVSVDATGEEIRRAYVALARHYHPDRLHGLSEAKRASGERRMQDVNRAYSTLGDPKARAAYDLERVTETPSQPPRSAPPSSGRAKTRQTRPEPESRDWRSYASPGAGGGTVGARPFHERLLTISPLMLGVGAVGFGFLGMLLRVRIFVAIAVALFVLGLLTVLFLPLFFMLSSRRNDLRGPAAKTGPTRQG